MLPCYCVECVCEFAAAGRGRFAFSATRGQMLTKPHWLQKTKSCCRSRRRKLSEAEVRDPGPAAGGRHQRQKCEKSLRFLASPSQCCIIRSKLNVPDDLTPCFLSIAEQRQRQEDEHPQLTPRAQTTRTKCSRLWRGFMWFLLQPLQLEDEPDLWCALKTFEGFM